MAKGPIWTCAKNLAPTGIRFPDRPARSQSLYRLSYRGPPSHNIIIIIIIITFINVTEILLRNCGSILGRGKNSDLLQDILKECAAHSQLLFIGHSGLLHLPANYHPSPIGIGDEKAWSYNMPLQAFITISGTALLHK
jgi:hypothetical protein